MACSQLVLIDTWVGCFEYVKTDVQLLGNDGACLSGLDFVVLRNYITFLVCLESTPDSTMDGSQSTKAKA